MTITDAATPAIIIYTIFFSLVLTSPRPSVRVVAAAAAHTGADDRRRRRFGGFVTLFHGFKCLR